MDRSELTKNLIFRQYTCGLSIKDTAQLCLISETEVTKWDRGETIPPVYKRLMRMISFRELHHHKDWEGFYIKGGELILPTGQGISPGQILMGQAMLDWGEPRTHEERCRIRLITQTARAIARIHLDLDYLKN